MAKILWEKIPNQVKTFIETEEWVQVPEKTKQQMLSDVNHPENMEVILRYAKDSDMVKIRIYRPKGVSNMTKFTKWILIPGIAEVLKSAGLEIK